MSVEAVNQFRAALAADPELQQTCMDAVSDGRLQDVQALARKLGFEFSAEDVQVVLESADELSDLELELVAGGIPSSGSGVLPK